MIINDLFIELKLKHLLKRTTVFSTITDKVVIFVFRSYIDSFTISIFSFLQQNKTITLGVLNTFFPSSLLSSDSFSFLPSQDAMNLNEKNWILANSLILLPILYARKVYARCLLKNLTCTEALWFI